MASLVAQMVQNPPAIQETWVQSLGWEDPLEEGMATHSSILGWRIPMDRGAWQAINSHVIKHSPYLFYSHTLTAIFLKTQRESLLFYMTKNFELQTFLFSIEIFVQLAYFINNAWLLRNTTLMYGQKIFSFPPRPTESDYLGDKVFKNFWNEKQLEIIDRSWCRINSQGFWGTCRIGVTIREQRTEIWRPMFPHTQRF